MEKPATLDLADGATISTPEKPVVINAATTIVSNAPVSAKIKDTVKVTLKAEGVEKEVIGNGDDTELTPPITMTPLEPTVQEQKVAEALAKVNAGKATVEDYATIGVTVDANILNYVNNELQGNENTKQSVNIFVSEIVSYESDAEFAENNPLLSSYVKDEGGIHQVGTDGATILTALKARLGELKAMEIAEETDRKDLKTIKLYTEDDIVFNHENIIFSADRKTVYIVGPLFNEATFKVAKGGKSDNYDKPFNFTILKTGYETDNAVSGVNKLARIIINKDLSVNLIEYGE